MKPSRAMVFALLSLLVVSPSFVSLSHASESVIATIPVGQNPDGLVYDSAKGEVFVANGNNNTVSVISDASDSVIATIPVTAPGEMAYDGTKDEIFVANTFSYNGTNGVGTVSVISD